MNMSYIGSMAHNKMSDMSGPSEKVLKAGAEEGIVPTFNAIDSSTWVKMLTFNIFQAALPALEQCSLASSCSLGAMVSPLRVQASAFGESKGGTVKSKGGG